MKKILIAFGHRRMRGKNTAAEWMKYFLQIQCLPVRLDAFAAPLKEICKVVFGFNEEQVNGDLKGTPDAFWGFTPRWALQQVGTELFRTHIDPDVWVKSLARRYQAESNVSLLVTDLRFKNEAVAIHNLGGLVVKCERNLPFDPVMDTHRSEVDLEDYKDWDYVLDNNGTMEHLKTQLQDLLAFAQRRP